MRHRISQLAAQIHPSPCSKPYSIPVHHHLSQLATQFSEPRPRLTTSRSFSNSRAPQISIPFLSSTPQNRILPSIRRPSEVYTLLQSTSSSNTLLLLLFKTSTCRSCATITPLISSIVSSRSCPSPGDRFSSIAFAELELDSPERDDGGGRGWATMYDVGIEYGVRSVPTLIGFGGRRAERVTERLADERKLGEKALIEGWIDEIMRKGDEHTNGGGGLSSGMFGGR